MMKIALITSCLERGKDGVGDYVQTLAQEFIMQGHTCCLVALNDRFLTSFYLQAEIEIKDFKIPLLRLSTNMSWHSRIVRAKGFLDRYEPEWLSLQFVCYGFHPKGIVYGLGGHLRQLAKGRKVHMMFHELWIGEHIGATIKERLIGQIQRFFVLNLVMQLQPQVVHTSNLIYVTILQQNGILSKHLPLFGAIPIVEQNGDRWLFPILQNQGIEITLENRHLFWLFGIFGGLYPDWPLEPLFTYLRQASVQHGRKVVLISIGRLGNNESIWENLASIYGQEFVFLRLGERSPTAISEFFTSIDFGIATTPSIVTGKSSSIAAMLEHGLPVIVNRDDIKLRSPVNLNYEDRLIQKMDCNLAKNLGQITRRPPKSRLTDITAHFLESLI